MRVCIYRVSESPLVHSWSSASRQVGGEEQPSQQWVWIPYGSATSSALARCSTLYGWVHLVVAARPPPALVQRRGILGVESGRCVAVDVRQCVSMRDIIGWKSLRDLVTKHRSGNLFCRAGCLDNSRRILSHCFGRDLSSEPPRIDITSPTLPIDRQEFSW